MPSLHLHVILICRSMPGEAVGVQLRRHSNCVARRRSMKHNQIACGISAYQHRALTSTVAAIVAAAPLLLGSSQASAETRGYVISWFATATNNPDFVQNCPQAAKDPNRVQFVVAANRGRTYRALVDGKPVPPLNYPDAVQNEPNFEPVAGKFAYGF